MTVVQSKIYNQGGTGKGLRETIENGPIFVVAVVAVVFIVVLIVVK